ncbi:mitochondrial carrier domain-containing protein [Emericellopsis atlantica]|uniref:Mitochondrial carrier domain-containing protein n=1 Tax=Emericellopsis atlantica TaxID=2614577 RepID=A0A9P7ZFK5_9HYPO|nr:mitochondrial carrier domain-containing protein [Emericellopsis atlantica]KAG9250912.1 mitochondrial carrier domain-containing protein [Emericellopsis atlantica]
MASQREGVNPLRPYYIPPTIGERAESAPVAAGNATTSSGRYASKARDVFNDMEYGYLGEETTSAVQSVKDLLDELLWKYCSVLMAQPFEVAKTILQVRDQDEAAAMPATPGEPGIIKRTSSYGGSIYDLPDSDSEGDEPSYFTSNVPDTPTPIHPRNRNGRRAESPIDSPRLPKKTNLPEQYLNIRRSDSVTGVISALWTKEGAWGVWKGSNATFLYTVLQSLLENWSRSFLSAILNVPDLGVKDDIDRLVDIASPYPWASLFVAASAAVATGVLLAPLDLVRTRLILTPTSRGQRRTLSTLRSLPSYLCSSSLLIPTMLHSLIHPILTLSTPLVLRTRFMIDSQVSPMTFSVAKFCASTAAIFVKLPLETVLRRGQMGVLSGKEYLRVLGGKEQKLDTIVPVGRYEGAFGTMVHIAKEEGQREVIGKPAQTKKGKGKAKASAPTYRKGQGVEGLWRGWKVSWWGLVGLWMAGTLSNGGEGEF